jgi:hypothetical protein
MKISKTITRLDSYAQISIFFLASIILFCLTGLSGCKEKEKVPAACTMENTVSIPKDMVERFFFRDSSCWIYQDTFGTIDSVYVTSSRGLSQNNFNGQPNYNVCYEGLAYDLHSTINGRCRIWVVPTGSADQHMDYSDIVFEVKAEIPAPGGLRTVYRFYYKGNDIDNDPTEDPLLKKIDSMVVENQTYTDILNYQANVTWEIYKEAWYVRKFGLIQYRDQTGNLWKLKRHSIK